MGKMSRDKGKRGELEIASILRSYGYDCKRGQQYHGGGDSPDVTGLPRVHIEVKRTERLDLYGALAQACRDAEKGNLPVVVHRRNDCPWVVIMELDDWMALYREWEAGQTKKGEIL